MLLFKDSKAGYPVYMLDKESMHVQEGRIVNVGQPYIEPAKPGQMAPSMQRIVDVTVEADGKTLTYAIPEMLSVTYAGNMVISTEREDVVREVKAVRQHSVSVIECVDRHKSILEKCDTILAELDVEYKEKRERDSRMDRLEDGLNTVKEMVETLVNGIKRSSL
jgi:hypothetical protein